MQTAIEAPSVEHAGDPAGATQEVLEFRASFGDMSRSARRSFSPANRVRSTASKAAPFAITPNQPRVATKSLSLRFPATSSAWGAWQNM